MLAQLNLQNQLPKGLEPPAVRSALTAVIRRQIEAPNVFDVGGWLRVGLNGFQPSLAEHYISTGSLYLCSVVLLPLGLPAEDPFWSKADSPWTAKRVWSGEDIERDTAL